MYPRIAIVSTLDGKKIVYGTYNEHISSEDAAEEIGQKWRELETSPVLASDIHMVIVIPNDGFPYIV